MQSSREQAAALAKQQIGSSVVVQEHGANTRHTGQVVGVTGYHAAQSVGGNAAVIHTVAKLDQVPAVGKTATIQYQNGRGKVQDRSVSKSKDLQR
jgi:hypothetical protein